MDAKDANGRVMSRIEDLLAGYRKRILLEEGKQMARMAERWYAIERRLWGSYLSLAKELEEAQALGQTVSAARLYQMERYRALLGQSMMETQKYQKWSAGLIEKRQLELAEMGVKNAQELIAASYKEAGSVAAMFNKLPVRAIEMMTGYASNGTPLYDLLIESYPDVIEQLTEALIDATVMGINPQKTARLMADKMAGNLQRALTVARTEQLRAYRRASTEQYKESGVVEGWYWRCAKQTRTCMACLAMDDGVTVHDLDEDLNDHPNGRCFKQPAIIGLKPGKMQSGKDFFESLDEEKQRKMMGDEAFEAWKEGQFGFEEMAARKTSEEWGTHVVRASLKEMGVARTGGRGLATGVERSGEAVGLGTGEHRVVSEALDVTFRGKLGGEVNETLEIIDGIHGDGELPNIPIKKGAGRIRQGSYHWGEKNEIRVSKYSNHPMMTTAHEIGHFIDHQGIEGGKWATAALKKDSPLYNWGKAIENSDAYKKLQNIQKMGEIVLEGPGVIEEVVRVNRVYAGYLLEERELWARSYAQYIAGQSGNPAMLQELKMSQMNMIPGQWKDADFVPIREAIEAFMRIKGWIE